MDFVEFKKIPRLSREMTITEKLDGTNGQILIINKQTFMEYHEGHAIDSVDAFINQYCLYCYNNGDLDDKEKFLIFAGSKNRWLDISSKGDNFGFAKWVKENAEELLKLGEGRHYGEWYGKGIQRGYGLNEKRFALFNVSKWTKSKICTNCNGSGMIRPSCDALGNYLDCPICSTNKQKVCPDCCEVVPTLYQGMFDTNKIEEVLQDLKGHGSYAVPFMNPEGIIVFHNASGQMFKKTIENDLQHKGLNG